MDKNKNPGILTGILFGCFFIAILAICANVFPYGDDFFYSTFSKNDFTYYVSRNIEHYTIANGRAIVHMLATLFLGMNIWIWRIVNAMAFTACAILTMYIAKAKNHQMPFCAAVIIFMFLTLDTQITRQSIYWLTGSFNYLYPMLLLLLYWMVLEKSFLNKKHSIYLPILAFFAAATTEQGSIMCFGLTLLILLREKFVARHHVKLSHILSLIFSSLGMFSVICAPGVFNRVDVTTSPVPGGLMQLVIYNIKQQSKIFFFAEYTRMIHITLLLFALFYITSYVKKAKTIKSKNVYTIGMLIGIIILVCYLWLPLNISNLPKNALTVKMSIFMLCIACGYLITLFLCATISYTQAKASIMMIALILGLGSQAVMLASPVYGPRVLVSFIFMAVIFAVNALKESIDDGSTTVLGGIFCFLIGHPYAVSLTVPSLYFGQINKNKLKLQWLYLGLIPLIFTALLSWNQTYSGYAKNAQVYKKNIFAIEEYKKNHTHELKQYTLPNDNFAWVMPYHNDYYNPYYTICFNLPKDTKIIWER